MNALDTLSTYTAYLTGPLASVARAAVDLGDETHAASVLSMVERSASAAATKSKAALHARAVDAAQSMALVPAVVCTIGMKPKDPYTVATARDRQIVNVTMAHSLVRDAAALTVILPQKAIGQITPDHLSAIYAALPDGRALVAAAQAELIGAAKP